MNNYLSFDNLIPYAETGVPVSRVCFSSGRISADMASHGGLSAIRCYQQQRFSDTTFYEADLIGAWSHLFRGFVDFGNGQQYMLEFNNTRFYPFGYESQCVLNGVEFFHRMTLIGDAIVFELHRGGGEDRAFDFLLMLTEHAVQKCSPNRTWQRFAMSGGENCAVSTVCDDYEEDAFANDGLTQCAGFGFSEPAHSRSVLALGTGAGQSALHCRFTRDTFKKAYFRTAPGSDNTAVMVLAFAATATEAIARANTLTADDAAAERQIYYHSLQNHTRLTQGASATLRSFIGNFPEVIRSLEVRDLPGAARAADSGYWVWGWDSMVHSDALLLAGCHETVRNRLKFYRDSAHPDKGIFHSICCNGNPLLAMAPVAQTIYCIMLYNYLVWTRDTVVTLEFYDFASKLIERVMPEQDKRTGLFRGVALYPDFPEDLGQTGSDLSIFNNAILFQALRAMQSIAGALGKNQDEANYQKAGDMLAESFRTCFFDSKAGYFVDSLDADTLAPRQFYPVYAILHLSAFADELSLGREKELAQFFRDHFVQRHGFSMFARDSEMFYLDGNQLGMYMPVTEGFGRRLLRRAGDPDGMLAFLESRWQSIQLPEALNTEAVNSNIAADNPGRKQAFTASSWYSLLFTLHLGLEFGVDVLKCHAVCPEAAAWQVNGLRWGNAVLDIAVTGNGGRVLGLELNGEKIAGNCLEYSRLYTTYNTLILQTEFSLQ